MEYLSIEHARTGIRNAYKHELKLFETTMPLCYCHILPHCIYLNDFKWITFFRPLLSLWFFGSPTKGSLHCFQQNPFPPHAQVSRISGGCSISGHLFPQWPNGPHTWGWVKNGQNLLYILSCLDIFGGTPIHSPAILWYLEHQAFDP